MKFRAKELKHLSGIEILKMGRLHIRVLSEMGQSMRALETVDQMFAPINAELKSGRGQWTSGVRGIQRKQKN